MRGNAARSSVWVWVWAVAAVWVVAAGACSEESSPAAEPEAQAVRPDPGAPGPPAEREEPELYENVYEQVEGLPHPSPEYSPQEVVRLMMEALQRNDEPEPDTGLRTCYNFASPANKRHTGPLEQFVTIGENPMYEPMLGHRAARYAPTEVEGDVSRQVVMVIDAEGNEAVYVFVLRRQGPGPFENCWMSDSVLRLDPRRSRERERRRERPEQIQALPDNPPV